MLTLLSASNILALVAMPDGQNEETNASPDDSAGQAVSTSTLTRLGKILKIPTDYREPLSDILKHTVVMVLCLLSIWIIHLVLKLLLGADAKFFDFIPVRYVTDVSEIAVIGKFIWEIIRDFPKIRNR
jgi:hypothetical protein